VESCALIVRLHTRKVMNYTRIFAASLCAFVAYFIYGGILFGALPWLRSEYAKYPAVYRSQEDIKASYPSEC
jgi:hypothetical protein